MSLIYPVLDEAESCSSDSQVQIDGVCQGQVSLKLMLLGPYPLKDMGKMRSASMRLGQTNTPPLRYFCYHANMPKQTRKPISLASQFVISFAIPTIVLFALSDESRLGPLVAMGLALLPPILLELYSFATGRKASLLSLFAIIGILLIGAISLFGLSEEWLGVRRAGIYAIGAVAILAIMRYKHGWVDKGLARIVDMQKVRRAASKRGTEADIAKHISRVGYLLVAFLMAIAVWSYILTIIVIHSPTGSSGFNAEYAELRLIGLPLVSLPLLIGMVAIMMYLVYGFEKHTGIEADQLIRKKEQKQ